MGRSLYIALLLIPLGIAGCGGSSSSCDDCQNDGFRYSPVLNASVKVNAPPELAAIRDIAFSEGGSWFTVLLANDMEGDELSYSVIGGSSDTIAAMLVANSTVIFSGAENYSGSQHFTVTVTDGEFLSVQEFTVTAHAVNNAPVITSTPIRNASEDQPYTYAVEVYDPDDGWDGLTWSLSDNVPVGMTIDENGTILWTPLEGVLNSGLFTIYVYDDEGEESLFDTQSYAISVTPINDSPQMHASETGAQVQAGRCGWVGGYGPADAGRRV